VTGQSWRHARVRRLWWVVALLALIVGVWATSSGWLPLVGRFLVRSDALQPSAAVVPMAGGGPQRVATAADLYHAGFAQWMIVASMPLNTPGIRRSYGELMATEAEWRGVPADRVLTVPGTVRTTYEEALGVRALAEERGFESLTVVTDNFHTRRAGMAFADAFQGSDIGILMRPATESWYLPESWWKDRDSLRETWTEYLKLVLYLIGYR